MERLRLYFGHFVNNRGVSLARHRAYGTLDVAKMLTRNFAKGALDTWRNEEGDHPAQAFIVVLLAVSAVALILYLSKRRRKIENEFLGQIQINGARRATKAPSTRQVISRIGLRCITTLTNR
ncbi:MAG: hypothetical protein R2912_03495 [Eubacteriales bacterium]